MLEKISNKKNVNVLSCVQKNDVITTKNLHIVTRQGTKTGPDNPQISKITHTHTYPDPCTEQHTYQEATNIFSKLAHNEDLNHRRHDSTQHLTHLIQTDKSVGQFIDLLHQIKSTNSEKQTKNICSLNQKDKNDVDPLVDLEIEGFHVRQVVLDFGSQVNIMTRDTWERMGRPRLYESGIYLKLADQGLIEPIGVWKNVDTTIKGISTKVDFEIIDPKEGASSFPALVGRPWGRKMKASISLDKE